MNDKETFVGLPLYERRKSLKILKKGDFKENYLLFITCFLLGKHHKIIESRIKNNFKNNAYIVESFMMLDEICGCNNTNIFKLGTLFDLFEKIDYIKHQKEIYHIFCLQLCSGKFNKKKKYPVEYKLYKDFQNKDLDFNRAQYDTFKLKNTSIRAIFFQALIYKYAQDISEQLFRIDNFMCILRKEDIIYLNNEYNSSMSEFKKLVENYNVKC